MEQEIKLIDRGSDLVQICGQFKLAPWLAVDTEFERVNTYYPELCLLQLSDGQHVVLVDPLTITDLQPLYDLLYDQSITKVFHAARQDLELFFHVHGQIPVPLFDTQIAAGLLGYSQQIGYANLVREVLGVELAKSETRTNWKRRPLSQNQMLYAADDVVYLARIYTRFLEDLKTSDQLELLNAEFRALTRPELYDPDPAGMWQKIKIARNLKGEALQLLKKLAAWRELTARHENLPRKWIMGDHALLELAKSPPADLDDLSRVKGVDSKAVTRYGPALLTVLR